MSSDQTEPLLLHLIFERGSLETPRNASNVDIRERSGAPVGGRDAGTGVLLAPLVARRLTKLRRHPAGTCAQSHGARSNGKDPLYLQMCGPASISYIQLLGKQPAQEPSSTPIIRAATVHHAGGHTPPILYSLSQPIRALVHRRHGITNASKVTNTFTKCQS